MLKFCYVIRKDFFFSEYLLKVFPDWHIKWSHVYEVMSRMLIVREYHYRVLLTRFVKICKIIEHLFYLKSLLHYAIIIFIKKTFCKQSFDKNIKYYFIENFMILFGQYSVVKKTTYCNPCNNSNPCTLSL